MFSANRIIAIDNEKTELDQLSDALHGLGIPCIPVLYPDQIPPAGATWFQNIRILFCDLHLMAGATRSELNYPVIGGLLERMSSAGRVPPLLVLWTAYPEDRTELEKYLAERHAEALPIATLALKKDDFKGVNASTLPTKIRENLDAIPQLRVLYDWQDDVAAAGDACVDTLLGLARQHGGELTDALDKILSALAQASYGPERAAECPGEAVQDVLSPLLQDRLLHLPDDAARRQRWQEAMSCAVAKTNCLDKPPGAAGINTALHVLHTSVGSTTGRERGAVVQISCPSLFGFRFGNSPERILETWEIKDEEQHRWMAIQVEAECDFAQQKSPCLPFVLAVEVPASTKLTKLVKSSPAFWLSPTFLSEDDREVRLISNVLFTSTISQRKAKKLQVAYRMRDQLINQLAFRRSQHAIRPGIVAL
jgi:hypothetical protein